MIQRWKKYMFSFLILIPVALVLLLFCAYHLQEYVIFPATRNIYRTPSSAPFNWRFEEIFLDVNGERTHAWFIPLEGAATTVLFSHGNAGNMADRLESIQLLRTLGFSVLAYDYGGYGRSTGRPSEKRIYADAKASWEYLTKVRGVAPETILLFGRSLGGAATAYLAARVKPAAVVLESTFCSLPAVVRDMPFGNFMAKGIRHSFPTLERVPYFQAPLLVIHSPEDTLIPYKHGKAIYEAAKAPKMFLGIRGNHNDGFVRSMDAYLAGWKRFLSVPR